METTAIQTSPEEIYHEVKQLIAEYLESLGLPIEHDSNRELFNLDKMISFTQLRNGVIRYQREKLKKQNRRLSPVTIDMALAERFNIAYGTVRKIRNGER